MIEWKANARAHCRSLEVSSMTYLSHVLRIRLQSQISGSSPVSGTPDNNRQLLRLLSPLQATGPQSPERAPEAGGGPVGLAQHGRRGRRRRGRSPDRHAATPPRRARTLLLLLLVVFCATARGGSRCLVHVLAVAGRQRVSRRRTSAPGVEHHQLRGCTFQIVAGRTLVYRCALLSFTTGRLTGCVFSADVTSTCDSAHSHPHTGAHTLKTRGCTAHGQSVDVMAKPTEGSDCTVLSAPTCWL